MKAFRSLKPVSAAIAIAWFSNSAAVFCAQQGPLPDAPNVQLLALATQAPATPVAPQSNPRPTTAAGPRLTLGEAERMAIEHNPNVSIAHLIQLAQGQVVREARSAELPDAVADLTAVDCPRQQPHHRGRFK